MVAMFRATSVFCLVVCALPAPVAAQAAATIAVGDRIRVWTTDRPGPTGRVSATDADTLELQPDRGAAPVSIALAGVTRIEISRVPVSRAHAARRGALWGAVMSGIAGAVLLGLQHGQVGEDGASVPKAAALGAFSGALFGGLIGGVVGAARGGEQWEPLWP